MGLFWAKTKHFGCKVRQETSIHTSIQHLSYIKTYGKQLQDAQELATKKKERKKKAIWVCTKAEKNQLFREVSDVDHLFLNQHIKMKQRTVPTQQQQRQRMLNGSSREAGLYSN